jgi:hypothetical protein
LAKTISIPSQTDRAAAEIQKPDLRGAVRMKRLATATSRASPCLEQIVASSFAAQLFSEIAEAIFFQ